MRTLRDFAVVVTALLIGSAAYAQGAKPAAGAKAGPMPGGMGKVGTPYKLGKKGDELQFTLEKAEFASRAIVSSWTYCAQPGSRLLVLTFAVQNPQKTDMPFNGLSFKMTAVSPDDENFVATTLSNDVYHPDRRDPLNMALKPVQKVRAIAVIAIHPQGPVNKLIIERGVGTPVLRYDLHGLVKPLTGVFAADKGLGSSDVGAGVVGSPIDYGFFDVTVNGIEESPNVEGYDPGAGMKAMVVRMTAKNPSMISTNLNAISAKLYDQDGTELQFADMAKNSSAEHLHVNPEPGAEIHYRLIYYAPAAAKAQKLVFYDTQTARTVVVPLGTPGQ